MKAMIKGLIAVCLVVLPAYSAVVLSEEIIVADSLAPNTSVASLQAVSYEADQPKLKRYAEAIYPTKAMIRGITGYVIVGYDVNESGQTENIRILEGIPGAIFYESAIAAVTNSEFEPSGKNYTNLQRTLKFTILP